MKKLFLLMLAVLMIMLSGCEGSDPELSETLSGTYVSVDDNTRYLVFNNTKVTLYESDKQVRSGEYRFQNSALIITYTEFSERYTLDENKETLYEGNSNRANFGEAVFIKGTGNTAAAEPSKTMDEVKSTPLTEEEARAVLRVWMDAHPFQKESKIADTFDDALAFEGSEYYTFYLEITSLGIFDVFVNKETGHLFSGGDGEEFSLLPLDTWYEQYIGYAEANDNDIIDDDWDEPVRDYYTIGDTVSVNGVDLTLVSASTNYDSFWDHTDIVFYFEVHNKSDVEINISAGNFEIPRADGYMMKPCDNSSSLSAVLKPDRKASGNVAFIYEDAVSYDLHFDADWQTDDVMFRVYKN